MTRSYGTLLDTCCDSTKFILYFNKIKSSVNIFEIHDICYGTKNVFYNISIDIIILLYSTCRFLQRNKNML